jgi:hypothetical protein
MSVSTVLSAIASQFDDASNRTAIIALAEQQVNRCWFKGKEDYAVALMAAHLLALFNSVYRRDGTAGAITSKREGDLAISFASDINKNGNDLDATSYGQQFQRLTKSGGFILGVTGGGANNVCSS